MALSTASDIVTFCRLTSERSGDTDCILHASELFRSTTHKRRFLTAARRRTKFSCLFCFSSPDYCYVKSACEVLLSCMQCQKVEDVLHANAESRRPVCSVVPKICGREEPRSFAHYQGIQVPSFKQQFRRNCDDSQDTIAICYLHQRQQGSWLASFCEVRQTIQQRRPKPTRQFAGQGVKYAENLLALLCNDSRCQDILHSSIIEANWRFAHSAGVH